MRTGTDSTSSPRRLKEGGNALLVTTVLSFMAMGAWLIAFRATHDTIRIEEYFVSKDAREESVVVALAEAAALLETGRPPSDPYSCIFAVVGESDTYDCTGTYASDGDEDHWSVTVSISSDEDTATLPSAPSTF